MPDSVKGIIIAILVVLLFGIYPTYRLAKTIDENMQKVAHQAMIEFVDSVREKGYVDVQDYKTFRAKLDSSTGSYDAKLEYYKKVIEPTYTDPNDFSTFQGTSTVRYDGYFTKQILDSLYPQNASPEDDPSRRFKMHVGDLFNVKIEEQGKSLYSRLANALFHNTSIQKVDKYGGMVRSEAP